MRFLLAESVPVVERLQTALHPLSSYVVLPIFALANAGVALGGGALGDALTSAVGLGIVVGLVWASRWASCWPASSPYASDSGGCRDHTTWPMVIGLGSVAGIGFTVSLFIAGLSFPGSEVLTERGQGRDPGRLAGGRGDRHRAAARRDPGARAGAGGRRLRW